MKNKLLASYIIIACIFTILGSQSKADVDKVSMKQKPKTIEPVVRVLDETTKHVSVKHTVTHTPAPTQTPEVPKKEQKKEPKKVLKEVKLSAETQKWTYTYCYRRGISPYLVYAIIERESQYKSNAMGDHGESYGLMQIKKKYQRKRMKKLGVSNLLSVKGNIKVGVDMLLELFEQHEDITYVLHCYNGGPRYANRLEKQRRVSKYAKAIIARAEELERLSEKE